MAKKKVVVEEAGFAAAFRRAIAKAKHATKHGWCRPSVSAEFRDLAVMSLDYLTTECTQNKLISKVPGKNYMAYALHGSPEKPSRPINTALFVDDQAKLKRCLDSWVSDSPTASDDMASVVYTMAITPCAVMELFDRGNKKGPATYFEHLVGHLFAREIGVEPRKSTTFHVQNRDVRMTMDFLFDHDGGRPSTHLPIKMSTRERSVQPWAHQRLLDVAFGDGKYKGLLVVYSETKLSLKTKEVTEICVPGQWLAYQSMLSKLDRIYYFDVPARYRELTEAYPALIQIKHISEFFKEKASLI